MSKQCETLEDALATVAHYKARDGTISEPVLQPNNGKYIVYRTSDNKTLKCVKYSEASLRPILIAANAQF